MPSQPPAHVEHTKALQGLDNEGFNIVLIEEDLLRSLADVVNDEIQDRKDAIRDREVEQVLCTQFS